MVESLCKDIKGYQGNTNELARILEYESDERIFVIDLLIKLVNNQSQYNKEKSFNENLQIIYQTNENVYLKEEQKKEFLNTLLSLYKDNKLIKILIEGINLFEEILKNERTRNAR